MSDPAQSADALERLTKCQLSGVNDEWDIDDMECADELRDAIQTVRDDHDHEVRLEEPPLWLLEVKWNEKREQVVVGTFGYHGEFEPAGEGDG